MQRRLQYCDVSASPKHAINFMPLTAFAGYSAEELYTISTSAIKRCKRRFCGRNEDNRTFVALKLLMRYGARREFSENAAISQLKYLGIKAQNPLDGMITQTSTAFYTDMISELRAW